MYWKVTTSAFLGVFWRLDFFMCTDTIKSVSKEAFLNQEKITLDWLLAWEEWYIVYVFFSPLRGPPEQVDRAITAGTQRICEVLWQLIIHTLPRSSVYQGLSQTLLVLLWHRKHRRGFFKPATHPLPSCPAVLLCWRDVHCTHIVRYTYTVLLFVLVPVTEASWKYY